MFATSFDVTNRNSRYILEIMLMRVLGGQKCPLFLEEREPCFGRK